MKKWLGLLGLAALVLALAGAAGCRQRLSAPEQVVQSVLELRSENSTDVAAYARYFKESAVATALADDAATAAGKSRIPEWKTPRVESSSDTSASVLVTWKASSAFRGWPQSTTFLLAKQGDRWLIVDANQQASGETSKTP